MSAAECHISLPAARDARNVIGSGLTTQCLGLLNDLEKSLRQGNKALLEGDADSLNCATAEQIHLCSELQVILPADRRRKIEAPELYAAVLRVLHLARLQAALLRRAQRFLLTLSRIAVNPAATYEALILRNTVRTAASPEGS